MTKYLILEESAGGWKTVGDPVEAHNADAAVRAVETEGAYVAVPARYWKKRYVSVATVRKVNVSDTGPTTGTSAE